MFHSYSLSAIDDVHGRKEDDNQNGKAIWAEENRGNWVIHRWRNGPSLDDLGALDINYLCSLLVVVTQR